MANLKPHQTILILGAGISGLLHLLLAIAQGAQKIIVTDINPSRLNFARKLGASTAIDAKENISANLRMANDGRLADLVIVCTSALNAFSQSLECVDRAGTILNFASPAAGMTVPLPVAEFWRNSIRILHSYGASPTDLSEALNLLAAKKINPDPLITHRLSLAEAGQGFQLVSEAKECIKVILFPDKN
jgi:L-iditol 2-dehydrogenase